MKRQIENIIKENLPKKNEIYPINVEKQDEKWNYLNGFNQALSQINPALIADEVLKVVVEKRTIDQQWKGKIICGFAGIGKSTLARNCSGVVDLESTPFEKDWARYAMVARHMAENGYTVLLSCHKEIREELYNGYYLAIPRNLDKADYIKRYRDRGNNEEFIKKIEENWDSYLERLPHESNYISVKNNLQETLSTISPNKENKNNG